MNADAEKEIERLCAGGPHYIDDVLRLAMRWTYADSARACMEIKANNNLTQRMKINCVYAIKQRAKEE